MKYAELCETYEALDSNPSRLKKTEILEEFLKKLKKDKDKDSSEIYLLKGRIFPDYDERETGISTQLAIKALSKATGASDKEIVKLWKKFGDLGLTAENIVSRKKQTTLSSKDLTTEKVLENLRKLPELIGKGTVDKKISLISELITSASPIEAKYLIRTLLGDLRVGVGEGTIRDSIVWVCFDKEDKESFNLVQEAYDKSTDWKLVFEESCKGKKQLAKTSLSPGKPLKVMLYQKELNVTDGFERVGKPALIDYKYDGFRMLINKTPEGNIKIFTRRLDEVTNQFPDVVEYIKKHIKAESFIIDSEAVGFDPRTKRYTPFEAISQRIRRKYEIEKLIKQLPIEVNVFDIIFYNGESLIKEPMEKRRKILEKIIKKEKYKIRPSEAIITSDEKEAEKFYKQALKDGQEGVMMKNLSSPYKPGSRVGYGVKIKPADNDFDLVIVKAEYGTGKRAGWLTSYTVACRNTKTNGLVEIGKVSTGLKEKEEQGMSFMELTKKLKPLIINEHGREVEVKPKLVVTVIFQNIQGSPKYSSGFALRFPRIQKFRPDRKPEDITTLDEVKKYYAEHHFHL